jgi:HAD superfamily hydrolase (TIGR01509 family)
MDCKAVLWDLDGTIIDSGFTHYRSWEIVMKPYGVNLTYEMFRPLFGMNNESTMNSILGRAVTSEEMEQITQQKEATYRAELHGNIELLPGVRTWLEYVHLLGLKQGMATSAPLENIDQVVDAVGIRSLFDVIVPGFGHPSKPDPWVFLQTSARLGVAPDQCIIIEDSVAGVQAAKSAGGFCLAVTTTNTAQLLYKNGADRVVDRLDMLDPVKFFAECN